jgi:hypothetical protein
MIQLGVDFTPIVLNSFRGQLLVVDAFNVLHPFLALIRTVDGMPLIDDKRRGCYSLHKKLMDRLQNNYDEIYSFYLDPDVTDEHNQKWGILPKEDLYIFVRDERSFSTRKVDLVDERMRCFNRQKKLKDWLTGPL